MSLLGSLGITTAEQLLNNGTIASRVRAATGVGVLAMAGYLVTGKSIDGMMVWSGARGINVPGAIVISTIASIANKEAIRRGLAAHSLLQVRSREHAQSNIVDPTHSRRLQAADVPITLSFALEVRTLVDIASFPSSNASTISNMAWSEAMNLQATLEDRFSNQEVLAESASAIGSAASDLLATDAATGSLAMNLIGMSMAVEVTSTEGESVPQPDQQSLNDRSVTSPANAALGATIAAAVLAGMMLVAVIIGSIAFFRNEQNDSADSEKDHKRPDADKHSFDAPSSEGIQNHSAQNSGQPEGGVFGTNCSIDGLPKEPDSLFGHLVNVRKLEEQLDRQRL